MPPQKKLSHPKGERLHKLLPVYGFLLYRRRILRPPFAFARAAAQQPLKSMEAQLCFLVIKETFWVLGWGDWAHTALYKAKKF